MIIIIFFFLGAIGFLVLLSFADTGGSVALPHLKAIS